jgi:hypothetical protein
LRRIVHIFQFFCRFAQHGVIKVSRLKTAILAPG